MNKVAYIGFDPGAPATMCLISPKGNWVAYVGERQVASKTPKSGWQNVPSSFVRYIKLWRKQLGAGVEIKVVVENVGPMPGEGVLSAAKFVGSIWMIRGICAAYGIEPLMVRPQEWKKHFGLISPGSDPAEKKELSRQLALKKFPKRKDRLKWKKDHNYAEAALLGLYGWENDQRG